MSRLIDLTGMKFGRLTVVSRDMTHVGASKNAKWHCVCDCGKDASVLSYSLHSGNTKSCGCLNKEITSQIFTKHGMSKSKEWRAWAGMKSRCYNRNNKKFKDYGARGIVVCERWLLSFDSFLEDMGRAPSANHSVDRVDVNGNYSPENCRWALPAQQTRNRRCSLVITKDGTSLSITEWARKLGIHQSTMMKRYNKEGLSENLLRPVDKSKSFKKPK